MASSDCLLDTPLTWHDVETEIQKTLNISARFGPRRRADNLGHMKGFMSRIALIEADWVDVPENVQLPEKLVVKISSNLALGDLSKINSFLKEETEIEEESDEKKAKMNGIVMLLHNLEVQMYSIIARENNPNIPTTKVYAAKAFTDENPSKGFLVSDYIEHVHSVPMYENIPYEDIVPVIDAVAAFSAMGERMSQEEKKDTCGEKFIEGNIKNFFPENTSEIMRKQLIEILGDEFKDKIETAMETFHLICGNTGVLQKYSTISAFLGHEPVLMHSDLWSANMIFTKNQVNRLVFKALIDFQTASLSSPGLDVASIALTCLSSDDRRKHTDEFLKRYYEKFVSNLKGAPVPYTFQQLHDSYELSFPAVAVLFLPYVWSYAKFAGGTALETARQKVEGIVEDMIVIQESNLKKFPDFFKAE